MPSATLHSWNVNGIRAVTRNGFTEYLKKYKPDVLGIQEIKIDDARRAKTVFDFAGYAEYWNPAKRPGYSGTALLIKSDTVLKPIKVTNGLGIPQFDTEGRVQTAEFKSFFLINAYFPNANHELSRLGYKVSFNKAMLAYIKRLEKKKPVVACGDFNVAHQEIDLKNPDSNTENAGFTPEERAGMDTFIHSGLIDTFRNAHPTTIAYSWWTYRFRARQRNVGWRIDYFLVSKKIVPRITNAYILNEIQGSDHCPVGITLAV